MPNYSAPFNAAAINAALSASLAGHHINAGKPVWDFLSIGETTSPYFKLSSSRFNRARSGVLLMEVDFSGNATELATEAKLWSEHGIFEMAFVYGAGSRMNIYGTMYGIDGSASRFYLADIDLLGVDPYEKMVIGLSFDLASQKLHSNINGIISQYISMQKWHPKLSDTLRTEPPMVLGQDSATFIGGGTFKGGWKGQVNCIYTGNQYMDEDELSDFIRYRKLAFKYMHPTTGRALITDLFKNSIFTASTTDWITEPGFGTAVVDTVNGVPQGRLKITQKSAGQTILKLASSSIENVEQSRMMYVEFKLWRINGSASNWNLYLGSDGTESLVANGDFGEQSDTVHEALVEVGGSGGQLRIDITDSDGGLAYFSEVQVTPIGFTSAFIPELFGPTECVSAIGSEFGGSADEEPLPVRLIPINSPSLGNISIGHEITTRPIVLASSGGDITESVVDGIPAGYAAYGVLSYMSFGSGDEVLSIYSEEGSSGSPDIISDILLPETSKWLYTPIANAPIFDDAKNVSFEITDTDGLAVIARVILMLRRISL